MSVDITTAPYYDDFDPSKKYTQILAVPGRAEQAREFTQIQSMLLNIIKNLSDSLLKDGNIISGMSFSWSGNTLTIDAGQVYIGGLVNKFDKQSITLTKTGTELVGVKLVQTIITENDDNTLRDPAIGYTNYSQPGGHRIKSDVQLALNDSSAATVYIFQDGNLKIDPIKPQIDSTANLLARRTYDEAGNYRVRGLELWQENSDSANVYIGVKEGRAYILGYEVDKPTAHLTIPQSTATRLVQGEPKQYHTATNPPNYALNNNPVANVSQVRAQVQVTGETLTRGSIPNGSDPLAHGSVLSIQSVVQGATTYVQGRDYQLTQDSVDWGLSGQVGHIEPATGTSYTVNYTYNKIMAQQGVDAGTPDYTLYMTGSVSASGDTRQYYIQFLSGDRPIDNTSFTVDYNFYLARKDLVSMDKDGNITVTTGQSNIPNTVSAPVINSDTLLNLGTVYLPPNNPNSIVNAYSVTRLSMSDLQRLKQRVDDLEYNQASQELDDQAKAGESPSNLKGIFSDGFYSMSKADLTHPDFNITFDLEQGNIVLPITSASKNILAIDPALSSIQSWGRLITAPYTESVVINQPYATTTMLVNPYNSFNKLGVVSLNPAVDNWVDDTQIIVQNTLSKTYNITRWWYHGGQPYSDTEKYLFNNLKVTSSSGWGGWNNITGTIDGGTTSKTLLDEAITYMRQVTVNATLQNYLPNSDNIQCYFDSKPVTLTPTGTTPAGTLTGTIKTKADGSATAQFTVPANVICGTRTVEFRNDNNHGSTSYTANGRKRTIEQDVLTINVTVSAVDPLAQAFQFDEARVLTSVGLFFSAVDANSNVIVQVRDMVNGYPGTKVYTQKVVAPGQMNTTGETKVTFDNPVMCDANTQYCFAVVTDSNVTSMYVADLGSPDITSGQYVTANPYLAGDMFSSSNAITWTAHQARDMKFKLYTAQFNSTGTIQFSPITGLSADRIVLLASYLTPQNTGCSWQMSLNGGAYQPIGNYEDQELSSLATSITLKATFQANQYTSPIFASDSWTLVGFLSAQSGAYVGRQVSLSQPYMTVRQVFEANIPSNCTVTPKFWDGTSWITGTLVGTPTSTGDGFSQFEYDYTYGASDNSRLTFRARLEMTSPSSVVRPRARKFMNIIK